MTKRLLGGVLHGFQLWVPQPNEEDGQTFRQAGSGPDSREKINFSANTDRMELPIEPKDSPWSGEDKGEAKEAKIYIYIFISATETRTPVWNVRGSCDNHLHYGGRYR